MAVNVYECMFLLDTNKVAGDVQNAAKQLTNLLEKNHAEILAARPWDERRLAYPIGNHKKGLYYLTYFRMDSKHLLNMERDIALMELILRNLVLKVDPKMVDQHLAMAHDEHALALQSVFEEPPDDDLGLGGGGEHRGRRPVAAEAGGKD